MWNAIKIMLNGWHVTFVYWVRYSKETVFSLIAVLLNFRKYLDSVLFPNIVISAFIGFVLNFIFGERFII